MADDAALTKEDRKQLKMREEWRKALVDDFMPALKMRRLFRMLPSSPRYGICMASFKGIGSKLLGIFTPFSTPSRKNPMWCKVCFEASPIGGCEVPTGVLFADFPGFTAYSESRSPEEVAVHLNRFYSVATDIFARNDAIIDKLVGDEVMALWLPGFAGKDTYIQKMPFGAEAFLRAVGYGGPGEPWLPIGLGLDMGTAFVGNVGSGEVKDFTALGDVVNTAARLPGEARPGQIVMSERVYQFAAERHPNAPQVQLELRSKSEPVVTRIVELSIPVAA